MARALRKLGPTWGASPIRRTIQVVSLALYMVLFFFVGVVPKNCPIVVNGERNYNVGIRKFAVNQPLNQTGRLTS